MVSEDLPEPLGMVSRLDHHEERQDQQALYTSTDGLTEEEVISYMI